MSSTNRGAERALNDWYRTPEWLVRAIVPELTTRMASVMKGPWNIYEPAAGKNDMVDVFRDVWPNDEVTYTDLVGNPPVDFLGLPPRPEYDCIVTNPPFSLAMEFIQHAMKFRRRQSSVVAMILRLNFLGSKKRAAWLREHPPAVYVSPLRPSFTSDGRTDSIEYAWFIWQAPFKLRSEIGILPTDSVDKSVGTSVENRQYLKTLVDQIRKFDQTVVLP